MDRKLTIAQMRQSNDREILIYCLDLVCNHRNHFNTDPLPDYVSLSDLEPRMRCTKCGKLGADIRGLNWVPGWGERPTPKPWPVKTDGP